MPEILKIIIKIFIISFLFNWPCLSDNQKNDAKFNALYLLNFARYISWPDSSNEIIVTVLGSDPVFYELKKMAIVASNTKKIKVFSKDDVAMINETDIIFIPERRSSDLPDIVKKTESRPVLIVTSKEGLITDGAGINLVNLYWKLRYEINLKNLKEHGLIADSILYKLGKVIQ